MDVVDDAGRRWASSARGMGSAIILVVSPPGRRATVGGGADALLLDAGCRSLRSGGACFRPLTMGTGELLWHALPRLGPAGCTGGGGQGVFYVRDRQLGQATGMAFKLASLVIVAAFLGVGAVSLSILSRSSASDGPIEKVGAPALAVNAPAGLDDAVRPVTSNALPSTEQGGVILVIAPAGIIPAELPVWKDAAGRRARVEVVSTMAAARSLAPSSVAAIVIENRTVEEVDWGWVQERFGSGTTVAGLKGVHRDGMVGERPVPRGLERHRTAWTLRDRQPLERDQRPLGRAFFGMLVRKHLRGTSGCRVGSA